MEGSAFISGVDPAFIKSHAVRVPSILEGIQAHLLATSDGEPAQVLYAPGCPLTAHDRSGFGMALEAASRADVVVLVLGDKAGLTPDCTCGETRDRADLGLPGLQEELARAVVSLGKPVVLVLVNGRPLAIPWLDENVSAILEAWLPGEEGAAAVAEILFGEANPGGKLPITFPRSVGQLPVNYNHKPSGNSSYWYVDYVETPAAPLYPFGHGLSYTTFAYSDLRLSSTSATRGEVIDVSLVVTNTGQRAGVEVVQLYVNDEYASIPRPVKELKGFAALSLAPGESRRLAFHLPVDLLAFYDADLRLVLEPGPVKLMLGSSSADIRLESSIEISGPAKMPVAGRLFDCPFTIDT
jgi:beta-glucosidase